MEIAFDTRSTSPKPENYIFNEKEKKAAENKNLLNKLFSPLLGPILYFLFL